MIRDAPVLLLDEPTTGLDAESTERVLAPLRRLIAGRTTLMISHNLLTVTDADRIVFLEDGRVGAVGSHTELLARSPGYARLYRLHHPDAEPAREPGPRSIGRHHGPLHAAVDRRSPGPDGPARHRADPVRPAGGCPPAPRLPEPATGALPTTALPTTALSTTALPVTAPPTTALPTMALPTTPSAWFDPDPPTVRLRLPVTGSRPQKGRHRRSPRPFPAPASVPEPEQVVHRPAAAH
jgi:hypothetical protein